MATQSTTINASSLLRLTLQLDALVSFIGAAGFLIASINPLVEILGFGSSTLPLIVGIALIIYAAWVFWITRQPTSVQRSQSNGVIVINASWVVGWLAVLIDHLLPLTLLGELFVGFTVVAVALFGIVEWYTVRKMR